MEQKTRLKLDEAKKCWDESDKLDNQSTQWRHKAAQLIADARKGEFQLTFREIGNLLGRSETVVRDLLKWHENDPEGTGPVPWHRGSHGTKAEADAAVDKYLKTVTPKELKEKIGPMKMVGLVAEANPAIVAASVAKNPKLADAIVQDDTARKNITDSDINKLRGWQPATPHFPRPDGRSLTIKMQDYSTKVSALARSIFLTWKDDAPLASEQELMFARNEVASMIMEFEEMLTKALRDTNTQEVDHAG